MRRTSESPVGDLSSGLISFYFVILGFPQGGSTAAKHIDRGPYDSLVDASAIETSSSGGLCMQLDRTHVVIRLRTLSRNR